MSVLVQIFSNARCMPIENLPSESHSDDFQEAINQMMDKAGHTASFKSKNIAIIPMEGDLRYVVMG